MCTDAPHELRQRIRTLSLTSGRPKRIATLLVHSHRKSHRSQGRAISTAVMGSRHPNDRVNDDSRFLKVVRVRRFTTRALTTARPFSLILVRRGLYRVDSRPRSFMQGSVSGSTTWALEVDTIAVHQPRIPLEMVPLHFRPVVSAGRGWCARPTEQGG